MIMIIFKRFLASVYRPVALIVLLLATTHAAFGLDLATARSRGLVGEVDTGYLAIPPGATLEAKELVESVNKERHAAYVSLAAKNGVTAEVSGQLTFEKRYPSFPAGTWVKIQGKWIKKAT